MLAWLAPILVFGLVVLVHELGHFTAAKLLGVYAPRFSIGFGRPLWRKRRGETEYVICVLPLGGYVRMASREDEATAFLEGGNEEGALKVVAANDTPVLSAEQSEIRPRRDDWDPEAMIPFGPKPVPENRWFESRPLFARVVILSAGVFMNILLALVVSTGLFVAYGRPYLPAVVDSVIAGRPAQLSGLARGDSIVAIGSQVVTRWNDVLDVVTASPGKGLDIRVVRQGQPVTLHVVPQLLREKDPVTGDSVDVGRIGAAPRGTVARERVSLVRSMKDGWNVTWAMGGAVVGVVGSLLTGKASVRELGGPIQIARSSVEAARSGLESLFSLIALLSINVAVLNMLPVPILDGGQILLNVIEAAKGSAFSSRTREYILRAGLLAIALLFALVMYNDIKKGITDLLG